MSYVAVAITMLSTTTYLVTALALALIGIIGVLPTGLAMLKCLK